MVQWDVTLTADVSHHTNIYVMTPAPGSRGRPTHTASASEHSSVLRSSSLRSTRAVSPYLSRTTLERQVRFHRNQWVKERQGCSWRWGPGPVRQQAVSPTLTPPGRATNSPEQASPPAEQLQSPDAKEKTQNKPCWQVAAWQLPQETAAKEPVQNEGDNSEKP